MYRDVNGPKQQQQQQQPPLFLQPGMDGCGFAKDIGAIACMRFYLQVASQSLGGSQVWSRGREKHRT